MARSDSSRAAHERGGGSSGVAPGSRPAITVISAVRPSASVLRTCQIGNKTRPQIERNALVAIDAALDRLHAPVRIRRDLARAQVDRLAGEMVVGGSIGFRDCDGDRRIDRGDFLPHEPPPPRTADGRPRLLGPDGLPHVITHPRPKEAP